MGAAGTGRAEREAPERGVRCSADAAQPTPPVGRVLAFTPDADPSAAVEAPAALRQILIVDDSRSQRKVLARLLSRWGFAVHEAGSGDEALAHCAAHPVDLILSDWMMPGMSGLDFCRAFRALPRAGYGYFILLTSKTDKGAVAQGLQEGADDFLTKPVNVEELRARIMAGERILRMERELQEKNRLVSDTLSQLQAVYDSLDRDLAQARRLQQSLVREQHRSFGKAAVSVLLRPAGHVGGDLVGFFPIGPQRVGLYGIDVSGHGVTSALLTARLAGLFSGSVPEQNIALMKTPEGRFTARAPADVAAAMNRLLLEELHTDDYCTLVYADADLATGRIRMVQAGHPHPMVQRACGALEFIGQGGLPIGLIPDAEFAGFETQLRPGDRLLLMSDGVTECVDPAGRELGEQGLPPFMLRLMGLRGRAFLEALVWELSGYADSADFRDDISAVVLEFDGPAGG